MLAKPEDSRGCPVAMSHSMETLDNPKVQRAWPREPCDALYPVDQTTSGYGAEEDALSILWGDVSMSARHPSRITA